MPPNSANKPLSRNKLMEIKLSSLLEITKAINNNYKTAQLLDIFVNVLNNQLSIDKLALIGTKGKNWQCILKFGVEKEININPQEEFKNATEITSLDYINSSLKNEFDIVVPVYHKNTPLAYILIGDLNDEKLEMSPIIKHLPFIQTLTNIIFVAIENKKLAKETIRQAAVQKELELAFEMQSMLFPSELPNNDVIQIDARYMPHQQVGGDYYDFIQLNEKEIAFCVADVSGKGVAAALLMSNFQANMRILFNHTTQLTDLVHELNSKVMMSAKGEKFITLFIAKLNLETKMLTYINAGHNPPLLMENNNVSLLKTGTTGLGMLDELVSVKEGVLTLSSNSTIICYTDGVTELENESNEDFGVHGLTNALTENKTASMADLNSIILKTLEKHKGNRNYIDDIALFSCHII